MHFPNSKTLCEYVAKQSEGMVFLSFSNGKDSLAAWLQLRKYFTRIIPFFMYRFPDISFVEKSLKYYEEFFETKIVRLPHPSFYRMLNELLYQPPEHCRIIEQFGLPDFTYDTIHTIMFEDYEVEDKPVYVATGVTAGDNMTRRISLQRNGALNATRRTFFPIFDWKKDDMIAEFKKAKVKLPIDYRLFGRSFDGVNFQFLGPVKEHYPEDYKKMLEWFPLAELDLLRMQYREEYYHGSKKETSK